MTVINNVIVYKLFLKIYFINEIYLKNLEYFIYEFLLGDLNNIKNYRLILIDVLKNIFVFYNEINHFFNIKFFL
ncbi:uncharacterized conserved protein ['Chrysanthemum coronarium' phytoplasma]|uniref:Uncharacterized conserved protein n=1 Tax='Chrysanthemum coronarium' phytoplasma TaxID=1520703 RepID=A0ABQ0J2R1_9MOLU|nr:uncharacterized conserved protein ['Chrysanthemum coronarium' phytoplasma]